MQLKTILNRIEHFKSFVYAQAQMIDKQNQLSIEVTLRPRANGRPICSGCGRARPGYDRLPVRRFEYVPLWAMPVFLLYAMRRVDCPTCGVTVEQVPWADGKCRLTTSYRWFLARWAKRLSWQEVARVFHTPWDNVFRAVKHAVSWGLAHRDLSGLEALGIDEIQWSRGHKYVTLVYQIEDGLKRLLWIGGERTEESLRGFFQTLSDDTRAGIRFVCSDMWKPYLNVIREQIGQAIHVLDRFHIMKKMNEAVDQVRRDEVKGCKTHSSPKPRRTWKRSLPAVGQRRWSRQSKRLLPRFEEKNDEIPLVPDEHMALVEQALESSAGGHSRPMTHDDWRGCANVLTRRIPMAFRVDVKFVSAAEANLGIKFPASFVVRMSKNNGGDVAAASDDWQLIPFLDTSDRTRLKRTCNVIVTETKKARQRAGFPEVAATGNRSSLFHTTMKMVVGSFSTAAPSARTTPWFSV